MTGMIALGASALAQTGRPIPGGIQLQESATIIMDSTIAFNNGLLMWIIGGVVLFVLLLLLWVMIRYNRRANPVPSKNTHNAILEVVWTVVPIAILVVIAVPSFGILSDQLTLPDGERKYLGSSIFDRQGGTVVPAAEVTIKATGYQWYWGYEYVDNANAGFESFMLTEAEIAAQKPGEPRLLAVDNELVVPVNTTVRLLVTAADVIHAYAVPSFGIKIDAVPGRLNETWFNARKTGIYYGQCSELCGKDHGFMPIAVRVVTKDEYAAWVSALEADGNPDNANLLLASLN
ncbi:MAG: cytochrome c oxidase subunit II [Alphaproteobacteria bacterium]|nr:cytochrome c oxidase subunit II [Alphaproteobacteria bacterium]